MGVLLQNLNDAKDGFANAAYVTTTNTGVGFRTAAYGVAPIYGQNNVATNQSYLRWVNAVDSAVYGINVEFQNRTDAYGWSVSNTNPANNAVGIYLNYARSALIGATVTGAKIGVQIQNAPRGVEGGSSDRKSDLAWETRLTGPGAGVAGSVGVLIDSAPGDQEAANANLTTAVFVNGFETGVKIEQTSTPTSGLKNTLIFAGGTITGNGTGIVVGDNSTVSGRIDTVQSVVVTGTGTLDPKMYQEDLQNPFYYNNPGNSGGSRIVAADNADENFTGSVTFGGSSTFSALLTGETAAGNLFDYNSAATYAFVGPPDNPVDGVVPEPYGALFQWFGKVTQSGNGLLTVNNAPNGSQYEYMFGANNSGQIPGQSDDPNAPNYDPNAGMYTLVGTDIKDSSHINMIVKLRPGNVSTTFAFGLIDFRGNVNAWIIDTTKLSSLSYTTLSFNLLSPTIDLTGPDGHLDLSNIAGWLYGGDQGVANDLNNVPISFDVDAITTSSVANSKLNVTGTVNLGGAELNVDLGEKTGTGTFAPTIGQQFTIIDNDGADAVVGTFAGAPQGSTVASNGHKYTVSYTGGTGNDVVLTYAGLDAGIEVMDRKIFYNASKFDGNSSSINASDDLAIAPDKAAFNGVGTAPLSAFTSYSRGINGIMVDIEGADGVVSLADFTFKAGANNMPSLWANAPAPSGFSIRPGAGIGGSDRVVITWTNSTIVNQWLQVVVEGNDTVGGNNTNTGLATSDVFFFGNRLGDTFTGSPPTLVITNSNDQIAVRNATSTLRPIDNTFDFNRDTLVNVADEIIARNNVGTLTRVINWVAPAAPVAEPALATEESSDDGGSAVASAPSIRPKASAPKVPGWITSRLASVDLNSGRIAQLFTKLAEVNTPGTRSLLLAANEVTDALDLDDSLLESLIDGLN